MAGHALCPASSNQGDGEVEAVSVEVLAILCLVCLAVLCLVRLLPTHVTVSCFIWPPSPAANMLELVTNHCRNPAWLIPIILLASFKVSHSSLIHFRTS